MVGAIAKAQRGGLSRRVIVWIAAYALVLQSLFAPLLIAPSKWHFVGLDEAAIVLCIGSHGAGSPATGGVPAGTHDDHVHCNFCVGCGSGGLIVPQLPMASIQPTRSVSVSWAVIDNPVPEDAKIIGKQARGPPLLT
jgi:hypothetical protein